MKNNRMSFLPGLIFITVITANINLSNASKQFKVGESIGWQMPDENNTAIYSQWAANNRFLVGDSLYFEYRNDSVLVVNKGGYYHCNTSNITATYTDGKTVIKLDKPGPAYFLSGAPDHCKNGQRLLINVMTLHPPTPITPPSPPSPSIAVPPQPPIPASPAPSPAHSSSGVSAVVTLISVFCALTISTTIVMLVI